MQIESLKMFCDLAETSSFTKAAQISEVTQSAVSQTITTLERHFGCLLAERSKKNFRLTPEGQVVYDYSKRILQIHGAMQSQLQEIEGVISGDIRVATVYSIGLYDLPACVKQFLQDFPAVHVHVEYRRASEVYRDIVGNIVDLGLVAYPVRDARIETVSLRTDQLVLACAPAHPLAKSKSIKLKTLESARFVGFEADIPTRKALDKLLKEQGISVEYVMQVNSIETVKRAVEIDSGVSILPEETLRSEVAKGTLVAIPIEGKPSRPLAAIYKKDKVLSTAMKQFLDLLRKSL